MEGVVDVPPYFLCPISLEMMRDPVTLCTGITYDRESIERWVFTERNPVCPLTKQPLADADMTPNHMLRRLIQAWCVANASMGVERFPTPKPPVDKARFVRLLAEARNPHESHVGRPIKEIRELVGQSDRNKRCAVDSGVADFLVSLVITRSTASSDAGSDHADCYYPFHETTESTSDSDEALSTLYSLQLSEECCRELVLKHTSLIPALTNALRRSSYQSRAYATFLLKSISKAISPPRLAAASDDLFVEIVSVLRDQISHRATRAALRVLGEHCPWGRNRVKACEAGAVPVLVDILLDRGDQKRVCEMALVVLDQLCGCAEGRRELVAHAAGVAVVAKKALRVSATATERAVRVLYSLAKHSATQAFLQEMLQCGAVAKLCYVLQVDSGEKTKQKVNEILRLHSKAWRSSPCIHLQSYPSN